MSDVAQTKHVGLLCPVCRTDLMMSERLGVEIDYCPKCRGVWLDRGELDKVIDASERQLAAAQPGGAAGQAPQPQPAATFLPVPPQGGPWAPVPGYPPQAGYADDRRYDRGHGGGHGYGGHGGDHGGILSRLFR